jgi:threonine/homoserine/homoserine lactone efflux protein
MEFHTWLLFVSVAMVAILSPGPAILLAINNSVMYDLKTVALSSLANILGLFTLSSAAMLGLGVVLYTSAALFTGFKVLGAIYLIYIGIKQFRNLSNAFEGLHVKGKKSKKELFGIFKKAYLVCVTNPKPIIFFTALFPLFMDISHPILPQFFILTFTFMLLSFITLMAYAYFAKTLKSWFALPRRATWFNRVSGVLFVGLGVGLLGLERK